MWRQFMAWNSRGIEHGMGFIIYKFIGDKYKALHGLIGKIWTVK